ncbi:MAG: UPF0280 family protein [bacterium]
MNYQEKAFRNYVKADNLVKCEVIEKETDLLILANSNLYEQALASALKHRQAIEAFIETDPHFTKAFSPVRVKYDSPPIIKSMAQAAKKAKVGPMAAVAGALAEFVGKDLLGSSDELIVENGGDIFLKINEIKKVAVYAGHSPFSGKIALEIEPHDKPFGICTTSGTSGHSFSFGRADAVLVISQSTPLADAAATAIGNVVKDISDIYQGLKMAKNIRGLDGVLIIKEDQMGMLGEIRIVAL